MEEPTLTALARELSDGKVELCSPAVGLWREAPEAGEVISAGGSLGRLEILGVLHRLVAPAGGAVVRAPEETPRARLPVGYKERLLILDPGGAAATASDAPATSAREAGGDDLLAFCAPSSGRFYGRPAPDKPAFVSAGDEIVHGHTVCLLEVMKTFNRIQYGGDRLPPRARVVRVIPADGDDLDAGDPILELE